MKRLLSRVAIVVFAVGAILSGAMGMGAAQAASDPAATIKNFYATLTQTMKHGPALGDKGRYDALAPVIRQSFDLGAMAQMAVGPGWAKLSAAERQEVTEAFARYTIVDDHGVPATGGPIGKGPGYFVVASQAGLHKIDAKTGASLGFIKAR